MPDITELLDRAAPTAGGPVPLDDIVRRGHRRKVATRAAAIGAPLAVVAAIVVAVVLSGGSPTGVVIDPPPMMESPDPTPTPSTSTTTEPTEPEPGEESPAPDAGPAATGWTTPDGLRADALVVEPVGEAYTVRRLGADGSVRDLDWDGEVPASTSLVPDGLGGVAWQPDASGDGAAPVMHRTADGEVRTLAEAEPGAILRLVGPDLDRDAVLVTRTEGNTIENTSGDLLSWPIEGGEPTVVGRGVAAWETGVSSAVSSGDASLYAVFVEASQLVLLDRAGEEDPEQVFLGGEATGEYVGGVGILEEQGVGVVLVGRMTGLGDEPAARLLFIDLATGDINEEIDVPVGLGFEGEEAWPGLQIREVSVADGRVLVNRRMSNGWAPPLVYDTGSGDWLHLEHRDAGPVLGRAFLAPASEAGQQSEFADCYTEDQELRNAAPGGEDLWDSLFVYLPCTDWDEPQDVHRVTAGVPMTLDLVDDLSAVLEVLLGEAPTEEQAERGYVSPVDGLGAQLQHVSVDETGHAVVDIALPNGANNLNTSHNSLVWHRMLFGTVFQFEDVTSLELRLDGSCEDYAQLFQSGGCQTFSVAQNAPWNTRGD